MGPILRRLEVRTETTTRGNSHMAEQILALCGYILLPEIFNAYLWVDPRHKRGDIRDKVNISADTQEVWNLTGPCT